MRNSLVTCALSVALAHAASGQDVPTTVAYLKDATKAFPCEDETAKLLFEESGTGKVTLRYRTSSGLTMNHLRFELEQLGPAELIRHEPGVAVRIVSSGKPVIEEGLRAGGWRLVSEAAAVCFAEEDRALAESYVEALNNLIRLHGGEIPPF